jgi:hypothetical protein
MSKSKTQISHLYKEVIRYYVNMTTPYKLSYDEQAQLIFLDLSNTVITHEVVDGITASVKTISEQQGHKIYILACWTGVTIEPGVADYYGEQMQLSQIYVAGIVRYDATDLFSNVTIRAQTVRKHLQGSRSNIYPTKEAALEAIRQLKQA